MDHEFWQQKWKQQEIGFHQQHINPALKQYWSDLPAGSRVLVPLCGKSKDMLWLLEQGYHVTGVELSEMAVQAFFTESKLAYTVQPEGEFDCYQAQAHALRIYCGDFFKYTASVFSAIYDRAALVALPEPMREQYVAQCKLLSDASSRILLITLEYDAARMQGPPFSVSDQQVRSYWGDRLEKLDAKDIIATESKFQQTGLNSIIESSWLSN